MESPYLHDVNELIHLANQMGLIDEKLERYYGNASNCITRDAVKATNIRKSQLRRVLQIEDIYGILITLPIGLGGALVVFTAEWIVYRNTTKNDPLEGERNGTKRNETKRAATNGRNARHGKTAIEGIQKRTEVRQSDYLIYTIFPTLHCLGDCQTSIGITCSLFYKDI